ncbi:hypothetical protein E4U21_006944 [Claviceps maximensis]|nr:hypothetical protein E4U21_006944 [Claviceps maximensis]
MPRDPWLRTTSKISIVHREIIYHDLVCRYKELLRIRTHALRHASPDITWYTAATVYLPEPSDTESEELRDDVKREDFPYLDEGQRFVEGVEDDDDDGNGSEEQEEIDRQEQAEAKHRAKKRKGAVQLEGPTSVFFHCLLRDAMRMAMYQRIYDLQQDSTLEDLLPSTQTFSSMLETFLTHLDAHCCPLSPAQDKPSATFGGTARLDDNPERHRFCLSLIHMYQLQEEINFTRAVLLESNSRYDIICGKPRRGWSRWMKIRTPRSMASFMKSGGLGSPLVQSCSPDEMVEFDSRTQDAIILDGWKTCVWESWEATPSAFEKVRPERRILVQDYTTAGTSACKKSGTFGEQLTTRW